MAESLSSTYFTTLGLDFSRLQSYNYMVGTQTIGVPTKELNDINKLGRKYIMVGIRPLGDRVVIKKVEAQEKTQGGLILTSAAKEQPQVAEVVAVGPGTKDVEMELKVGDRVIFSKYGGAEVKYRGEEYTIMHQGEILAVIE